MAVGKEIRGKIKSIENTRKITKAMEMVAASKMRRAQERMRAARPYSDKVRNIVANLARANPEYRSPYMRPVGEVHTVGYIIVSTDKGLCGGLNTNLLRAVSLRMRDAQAAGQGLRVTALGSKGQSFMDRAGAQIVSQAVQLGDTPHLDMLIGPVKVMLDAFVAGEIDAVYLFYTRFINTMKQESVVEQLLPLTADRLDKTEAERQAHVGTTSTSRTPPW